VVNRLARWVRSGLGIKPDWQVPHSSVNLSTETLEDPEFGPYVCRYVDDSWLSNGAIGFEIARDTAIDHRDSVQRLIAQVRPYRCHLSLTGFDGDERSMAALRDFKPEFVKINVATIDPARVSEISRACHAAGSRVVAEYVENDRVLDHLRRSKIEFAQGFAISQVQPL
jgi:EAL domain-containing protein (putative c-di-GMP-specific phosphodiesterase class I)